MLYPFIILIILTCLLMLLYKTIIYSKDNHTLRKTLKEKNSKIHLINTDHFYLECFDASTSLPNIKSLYKDSKKSGFFSQHNKTAIILIHIDDYENISKVIGYIFIKQLMLKVSERLLLLLNKQSSLYYKKEGEFIIKLGNLIQKNELFRYTENLIENFKESFCIYDTIHPIKISIGIALSPDHGTLIEELIHNAEIAIRNASKTNKQKYCIYNQYMSKNIIEKIMIQKCLFTAIEHNEFELYYQPQYDLKGKNTTTIEALLRWHSTKLGSISPEKFIKVAEDTHLIIPIGSWVLKKACCYLSRIHKAGYRNITISVNISIAQLLEDDFVQLVMDTLALSKLKPYYLELEITETLLIESFDIIGTTIKQLQSYGIKIALDDFGKGYSSLNYLKQLPINTLKIDKSFIDENINNHSCESLVQYIIQIGHCYNMNVVAEGVETSEQLEYLSFHQCDKIQGYFFSKPLPEKDMLQYLSLESKG